MNYARLIETRGRACLWLAEVCNALATRLRRQATRDLGRGVKPDDLFGGQ